MRVLAYGRRPLAIIAAASFVVSLSGCPPPADPDPTDEVPHTLYVGHNGLLASYEISTGEERPGTVTGYASPTDLQALSDGTVISNLTGSNEVLAVNGATMIEAARVPSSGSGGR